MSRYIDVDELLNLVKQDEFGSFSDMDVIKMVNSIPTVDAVPVVRCKECIFAHLTYDGECKYCDAWSGGEPLYLDGDFYCSFGEKVTE